MYKTKSNKLSILLSILAVIVVIGLCGGAYMAFFRKPVVNNIAQVDTATNEQGEVISDGKVHSLPKNILFSAGARNFTENLGDGGESEPINAIISAEISPAKAGNKAVDWSLEFVNSESEWASDKTLSDYVRVTPNSDGALVATVSCYQAFGEQIRLNVTSRDNPAAKASCLIDFKQQFTGMEISLSQEGKEPTVSNSTKKGTVYADFENENPLVIDYTYLKSEVYTVPLEDGEIAAPVLTVEYKASFITALNNAKAWSAKLPVVNKNGAGCSMSLLSKDFIEEDYTAEEVNAIISAVNSNKNSAVIFNFNDGNGTLIASYALSIDTSAIQNNLRVLSLTLGETELLFGEDRETYNITYMKAGNVNGKTLFEIGSEYGLSKISDGYYPETYTAGESVEISDLKTVFYCSGPNGDYHSGSGSGKAGYRFNGWYLDDAKTVPFNGIIPAGTIGDIVLYADIVATSTHAY